MAPLYAWFAAQGFKFLTVLVREHRIDLRYMLGPGGMPSAHTALVTSLATAVGRREGLSSPLFAIAFFFAAIVMYDAAGVRRAVGIQAGILNRMLDEYFAHQNISEKRLRELVGHTPIQVLAGGLLGVTFGFLFA
ncbi:MAG: divergent PAP2 family protein [Chloroflexi bacterium]|nr:divergent PAP2 family protein [Chloroflexota bacterium]